MENVRGQFTFYSSFAAALGRIRKRTDRCEAYDAIVNYALFGIEPETASLPAPAAIAFDLIRPTLDTARRKALGGSKRKDTDKIPERYEEDSGN